MRPGDVGGHRAGCCAPRCRAQRPSRTRPLWAGSARAAAASTSAASSARPQPKGQKMRIAQRSGSARREPRPDHQPPPGAPVRGAQAKPAHDGARRLREKKTASHVRKRACAISRVKPAWPLRLTLPRPAVAGGHQVSGPRSEQSQLPRMCIGPGDELPGAPPASPVQPREPRGSRQWLRSLPPRGSGGARGRHRQAGPASGRRQPRPRPSALRSPPSGRMSSSASCSAASSSIRVSPNCMPMALSAPMRLSTSRPCRSDGVLPVLAGDRVGIPADADRDLRHQPSSPSSAQAGNGVRRARGERGDMPPCRHRRRRRPQQPRDGSRPHGKGAPPRLPAGRPPRPRDPPARRSSAPGSHACLAPRRSAGDEEAMAERGLRVKR